WCASITARSASTPPSSWWRRVSMLRVCTPHCGLDPETTSGGETFERELLQRIAPLGVHVDILLARHKRHPEGVANWTIHRLPIGRGLRWPVAPLVVPG